MWNLYLISTAILVPLAILWTAENLEELQKDSLNPAICYYISAAILAAIPVWHYIILIAVLRGED